LCRGISGDAIVYIDGARIDREPRRFVFERFSWSGRIDPADPTRVDWRRLPHHPGPGLYGAAAAWLELPALSDPSMDQCGLLEANGRLFAIGGLNRQRRVRFGVSPVELPRGTR